jgi:hypothetical protein
MRAIYSKGNPVADDASVVCVLFDPSDGRIVHIHGMTRLDGGPSATEAELEQRALENARHLGHSTAGIEALHVPLSAIRQRGTLKVDGGTIVPVESPVSMMGMLASRHR